MTVITKTLGTCECIFDESTGELVIGAGELPDLGNNPIYTALGIEDYSIVTVMTDGNIKLGQLSGAMFYDCNNLTNLDVGNWDTSNVTDMSWMFSGCNNLTNLDVGNWDTSNVTDMSWMFSDCNNLTNLDVGNWDTSNVTDMSWMFSGCNSLTSLTFGSRFITDRIRNFYNLAVAISRPASNVANNITVNSDSEFMALTPAQRAGTWKLKIPITAVFNADNKPAGLTASCTYSGAVGAATLSVSYANVGSTAYTNGGSATSATGSVTLTNEAAPANALSLLLCLSDTAGNAIYYRTTTAAVDPIMTLDGEGNLTTAGALTATSITATGNLTVNGTATLNGSTNAEELTATSITDTGDLTVSGTGTFGNRAATMNGLAFIGLNVTGGTANDTRELWRAKGNCLCWFNATGQLNGQPNQYGYLLNIVGSNSNNIHQEFWTQSGVGRNSRHWYRSVNASTSTMPSWTSLGLDSYPVGAVYISYVSTSPASLFGGSWTQITDRFLRMANDVSTGGANSITHRHLETVGADVGTLYVKTTDRAGTAVVSGKTHSNGTLYAAGTVNMRLDDTEDTTTNNMPAYQDLYAWRRTA